MKLTESEIAKFIEEEMKSDPALKNAIDKLSNKIDNLDVSIDYLASALTGEDVLDIGLSQKALGRFRTAPGADLGQAEMSENVIKDDLATAKSIASNPEQIKSLFMLLQSVVSIAADQNQMGMMNRSLNDLYNAAMKGPQ
tara:strand:+ start:3139 stop:3558 length:420 start_codon:yes stop_codon:yes gene_type:complete